MSEEKNKELNRVEERLKELSECELFLDNIFIKDKTARQIIVSAYNKLERQQKEIERIKSLDIYKLTEEWETGQLIHKDKIKEKQKELEEQKEKLKYDGNRCFADYEQFCKNLKFFNEQIEELLEEK